MKNSSQQIYSLLKNENLDKALQVLANGSQNPERNETNLQESIERYFYIRDILIEISEKELLDNLPYSYRNAIHNTLNSIFSNRTNPSNLLGYLESLNTQFYTYKVEFLLNGIDFSKDLQKAVKERQEYRKISNTLRQGLKWAEDIEPKFKKISDLETQVQESVEKIESNRKLANEARDRILETQIDVDSKKVVIDNTFESADGTREILTLADKEIRDIEKKYVKNYDSLIQEARIKNKTLQDSNISIQEKVKELLQGATGGKLHEGFINRKKELERTLNVWLLGIIILNLLIMVFSFSLIYGMDSRNIGPIVPITDGFQMAKGVVSIICLIVFFYFLYKKYLFQQEKYLLRIPQLLSIIIISFLMILLVFDGVSIPEITKIEFNNQNYLMPLLKIIITIPLIILDWFLIKEYSYRKDFVEKYTFKSAISLSLLTYRDLIKEESENSEAVKFINNAIEKIYKDPFENDKYSLAKKEKDLLATFVDNLSGKIIKNGSE